MLGFITRAVFGLEVTENKGMVRISGIRAYELIDDINKTFGTTRVTVNMLSRATRTYVDFHSFFLIDVEYIVRTLSKQKHTRLGRRGYVKMHEALLENTWLRNLTQVYPSIFNKDRLKEIKFTLLPHQTDFIDYYDTVIPKYNLRGMLMAATPGSGKTISAIAVSVCYEAKNVIIVAPKNSVFRVWEKTLLEDMNGKQTTWVQASGKPMPQPKDCRWYIFHYESLDKAVELAGQLKTERCTIVLDESHNMNEMKSLRTERFVTMCRSMTNSIVVELSGTPMKAMGAEAIPLISAIDPLFNANCVEKFKKIYGREAKAATAILANRLGIIMYKVNKEESKIEEPVEHILKVTVPHAERFTLDTIKKDMNVFILERTEHYKTNKAYYHELYYAALKEFESTRAGMLVDPQTYETYTTYVNEFKKRGYDPLSSPPKALFCNDFEKNIIIPSLSATTKKNFRLSKSVVKYVNLKIRGECLGTVLSRARTDCNLAVLDNLDLASLIDGAQKKTLVFTSYVELVKATKEKLEEQGYHPLCVYAETNAQLPQMVKRFGEDESINPLIATYQSLSTAVPLIMANRVILLNAPFRIHEKEQTVARANRLGQDKTVDVYNVLLDTGTEPNISTRSNDIMEWSREQVNAIMGFDNIDSGVALESHLQGAECLVDIDNHYFEGEQNQMESSIEDAKGYVVDLIDNSISINTQINTLTNEISTINHFINSTNSILNNGSTLNKASLEMYSIIAPSINLVAAAPHPSNMLMTVASLEDQKIKRKSILKRLFELLLTLLESMMNYFQDATQEFTDNLAKCRLLKRVITEGKTKAFSDDRGVVTINGGHWLTRGGSLSPETHLTDMEWQRDTTLKIVNLLIGKYDKMIPEFNRTLNNLSVSTDLNTMPTIMTTLRTLTSLLPEAKKTTTTETLTYTSSTYMGGRQMRLRYPVKGDSKSLINNHSLFLFKTSTVVSGNNDPEMKCNVLNKNQALQLLDLLILNNRELTHVNAFVNAIHKESKRFIKDAERVEDKSASALDEEQMSTLVAQLTLMINGVKALSSFTKDFVSINNHASKVSINYIVKSANHHVAE